MKRLRWLAILLALAPTRGLTAQQVDTVIFRRAQPICVDSTTLLVRELLARDRPGPVTRLRQWGPLVLSGLTLLVVIATRHNAEPEPPLRGDGDEDDHR
jgi:hypothetical protein